jgi:predicted metal-dependent hydrolase
MEETNLVTYGSGEFRFELIRCARKTLGITVNPDTTVVVRAPQKASYNQILPKVQNRARWILKQIDYFESFLPLTPPREYVSGETHLYLGKQYKLKVTSGDNEEVRLLRGQIIVITSNSNDSKRVRKLLIKWYKEHTTSYFEKKFNEIITHSGFNIDGKATLKMKRMNKRWGSCTPTGKVIVNPEIIKAPSKCIEYVFIHELCHIKYPNHGKEFYSLQEKMMPDWKRWKDRLERLMV